MGSEADRAAVLEGWAGINLPSSRLLSMTSTGFVSVLLCPQLPGVWLQTKGGHGVYC
jgi:hypothetical protein